MHTSAERLEDVRNTARSIPTSTGPQAAQLTVKKHMESATISNKSTHQVFRRVRAHG